MPLPLQPLDATSWFLRFFATYRRRERLTPSSANRSWPFAPLRCVDLGNADFRRPHLRRSTDLDSHPHQRVPCSLLARALGFRLRLAPFPAWDFWRDCTLGFGRSARVRLRLPQLLLAKFLCSNLLPKRRPFLRFLSPSMVEWLWFCYRAFPTRPVRSRALPLPTSRLRSCSRDHMDRACIR